MKLEDEGVLEHGRVRSEGKILEVIPVIEDASGQPMMLPPVLWHVPNFVLGYEDYHSLSMPLQFWNNVKTTIPGSRANLGHRLTFLVRILEDSEMPDGVSVGHIDVEAVRELIQAVRIAPDVYPAS